MGGILSARRGDSMCPRHLESPHWHLESPSRFLPRLDTCNCRPIRLRESLPQLSKHRYTHMLPTYIHTTLNIEGYCPVSLWVNGDVTYICQQYIENIALYCWFVLGDVYPLIAIPFTRGYRSYTRGICSIWCYSKHHWIQIVTSRKGAQKGVMLVALNEAERLSL